MTDPQQIPEQQSHAPAVQKSGAARNRYAYPLFAQQIISSLPQLLTR
jgi:hypothetical protein